MPESLPFDEVYRLYGERVYRFCLSQIHNVALAEDIAAETFVAAYAAYAKRQPDPEGVHLWLFRIARNLVSDHRRRERRRDRIHQIVGRAGSRAENVEQIAATNSELARVLSVIREMKERDRKLIALRIAGELSNREVAAVLGITENAAAVGIHRALERFRQLSEQMP